ncbi:helix-turn-helix domain-containing protein [Wielerella bovis]|uniref:helix-turn-helix domain-containing protein n=1 Tax=Wielerella bovis TaxID=2917790 RepID=UPI0020194F6A|nr:helix-turn-helix transcriptional regulator [Wielerella bovis]ULJ69584.1 helix-turn-helix domain-containing protein [Wielerella bovis]
MKALRELNGLTQDEMASKLEMTTNGYTQIERNVGNPNLPKIEKIAKVFDMTTLEFLDFCENGATFYISTDNQITGDNHGKNYYVFGKNGHEMLLAELEKAELAIELKDELLIQKDNEIAALKEIITLMKK